MITKVYSFWEKLTEIVLFLTSMFASLFRNVLVWVSHLEVVTAPRWWVYPLPGDDSAFLGHNLLIIFPGDKQSKTEISKITLSGQSCQFDLSKWSFISIMDQIFRMELHLKSSNSEEEDNSTQSGWKTFKIFFVWYHSGPWL